MKQLGWKGAMRIAITAGLLLLLAASPAFAGGDWVDIKDPAELRALYANKTFKGKDWMDRPWVGHYRADGKGLLVFEGSRYPRTWEVKGSDQVCLTTNVRTMCYRFQRHSTRPNAYRLINVQDDRPTEFTVADGVPNF